MFSPMLIVFALVSSVLAASVECIVSDLHTIQEKTELLNCLVNSFSHDSSCLNPCHDLKSLTHVYLTSLELDGHLEDAIDDIQTSCSFSDSTTQRVLTALAAIEQPLTSTLNAFSDKACDFQGALGPHLSHKIVGGTLLYTRFLTLNLVRSIFFKSEPLYRPLLRTSADEINGQFLDVIRKY